MRLGNSVSWCVIAVLAVNPVLMAYGATPYSLPPGDRKSDEARVLPAFSPEKKTTPISGRDKMWWYADTYPAERFEIDALIESLDYEAESAFHFVRDSIQFDPYRGVLRGAHGALGAQAGNSIDRSLLLAELLDAMGFESRLAFGDLEEDAARRVLARSIDQPSFANNNEPTEAQKDMYIAMTRAYDWLVAAVGDNEIGKNLNGATIADVRQHAWVQFRDGSTWVDMDSSFPDAAPGDSFATAESFESGTVDGLSHKLVIAVVAETVAGKNIVETTVLEHEIDIPGAARSQIFLSFAPRGVGMGQTIAKKLGPGVQYQPVLQIDEARISGQVLPGLLTSPKELSDVTEFFYGAESPVVSALYLDVSTASPSGSKRSERRVLFDRIASSDRMDQRISVDALTDLRVSNNVPMPMQELHQILVSNGGINPRQVWNDAGYAAWYPERLNEMGESEMSTEQFMWMLGVMQSVYPAMSEAFSISPLNDLRNARFFVGEPRVFLMSMAALKVEDKIVTEQSIDLLLDDIQFVSNGAPAQDIAKRKRWYGVLQSALETTAGQSMALAQGFPIENVSSPFYTVGGDSVVIKAVDQLRDSVAYPARLVSDLKRGQVVIHAAGMTGEIETWWTISPTDGLAKAMLGPSLGGTRFSPGSTSYSYYGGGGSHGIGGTSNATRYAYRIYPDFTSRREPIHPKRAKPTKRPPKGCKGGGTEYQTVLCNVSLQQIQSETLLLANIGLLLLIGLLVVDMYLREKIADKYGQGQY